MKMASDANFTPVKPNTFVAYSLREKTIVLNVHDALAYQQPASSVRQIVSTCSNMTGVSERTIYRFLNERKSGEISAPKQNLGRKSLPIDVSDRTAIRRKVHSFYINKKIPTIDKVLQSIQEDNDLPQVGRTKLWKLLREIGFSWEKQNRKSLLIDKDEIVCWRRNYLRTIRRYRSEGRAIYYLDETWINEGHTVQKTWVDTNIKTSRQAVMEGYSTGLPTPIGKGRRLIITHIGNEHGFVDGGLLQFVSKSTKDYHEEMNADVFEDYFSQMIELLPANAVIVMDNASYHSRLKEPLPTSKWKKQAIFDWLQQKGLPHDNSMLRKELLSIARQCKANYKQYVVDEMAKEKQKVVLRLPPYHCELNPIELMWAQVKGDVARNNTTFKLDDVRQLLAVSLSKVTSDNWRNALNHALKEEQKMWDLDNLIDETVESLVISIGPEDSSDADTDDDCEMDI